MILIWPPVTRPLQAFTINGLIVWPVALHPGYNSKTVLCHHCNRPTNQPPLSSKSPYPLPAWQLGSTLHQEEPSCSEHREISLSSLPAVTTRLVRLVARDASKYVPFPPPVFCYRACPTAVLRFASTLTFSPLYSPPLPAHPFFL